MALRRWKKARRTISGKIAKTFRVKMATHSGWDYINLLWPRVGHRVAGEGKLSRVSLSLRIIVLSRPAWHIFSSSAASGTRALSDQLWASGRAGQAWGEYKEINVTVASL